MSVLYILFYAAAIINHQAPSQDTPVGFWKSIDDHSGEARSVVEIYERDGLLHGAIRDLLQKEENTLCDACKGQDHNKPIVGLEIIRDMKQREEKWHGGTILDPESGSNYRCVFWLDDQGKQLKVRGKHWTGLYRTQTWHRMEAQRTP